MHSFTLPKTTEVKRVVPKNSFDSFATPKQKRLFTELVQRITWSFKLSTATTNLPSSNISEVQIFTVELKQKSPAIKELLDLIDKCIPYNILFKVIYEDEYFFHTSIKRHHAQDEDKSVIDFSFVSGWSSEQDLILELKTSIDSIYLNLSHQLSDFPEVQEISLDELVAKQKEVNQLRKEIAATKAAIKKSKSFKTKVDLNQKLKVAEKKLESKNPTIQVKSD